MNVSPMRRRAPKPPKWQPKHAGTPFPEPEQTLPEALAGLPDPPEVTQSVPDTVPGGVHPYEDTPPAAALARLDRDESWPAAANLAGDPLNPSVDVLAFTGPLLGDSRPEGEATGSADIPAGYRVPLDSRAQLYTGSGWTRVLTAARIGSGEWDDVYALSNGAVSRARASLSAAIWNARDTIGEGWRQVCIEAGRTALIHPGWKKIRDLTRCTVDEILAGGDTETLHAVASGLIAAAWAAEAAAPRRPSFTPAAPTAPLPVLPGGRHAATGRRQVA